MDDLIAFVRRCLDERERQLDEDERLTQACIEEVGSGRAGDQYSDGSGTLDYDEFPSYRWGSQERELAYMAGPGHPDRVLEQVRFGRADIGAKRQRIAWLLSLEHDMPEGFPTYDSCRALAKPGELGDLEVGYCSCGLDARRRRLFMFEALPYTGRPGFRDEWRP